MLLGPTSAPVKAADGKQLPVAASMEGMPSIMFDGIVVPAGKASTDALAASGLAKHFLLEGYKHLKALVLTKELAKALGSRRTRGCCSGMSRRQWMPLSKRLKATGCGSGRRQLKLFLPDKASSRVNPLLIEEWVYPRSVYC